MLIAKQILLNGNSGIKNYAHKNKLNGEQGE